MRQVYYYQIFGTCPQRCIKCGGMAFRSRRLPGELEMVKVAESLKRMHSELAEVSALAASSRHRRRKAVQRRLAVIRGTIANTLKMIIDTADPTRNSSRDSLIGETPERVSRRLKLRSNVV